MAAGIQSCHKVTVRPCNLLSAKQAPKLQGFNKGSETILKGFSNHKTEYSKIKFSQNTTNLLSIKVAIFFYVSIFGNLFLIKALSIKIDIGTTLHNLCS